MIYILGIFILFLCANLFVLNNAFHDQKKRLDQHNKFLHDLNKQTSTIRDMIVADATSANTKNEQIKASLHSLNVETDNLGEDLASLQKDVLLMGAFVKEASAKRKPKKAKK